MLPNLICLYIMYSVTFDKHELIYNNVFYTINVLDKETFHQWAITVDLPLLEEMHDKVQDENPEAKLPEFPKPAFFARFLQNYLFQKPEKADIAKQQKDIEMYLYQLMGPLRPPKQRALRHFFKHGSLKTFSTAKDFDLGFIKTREELYRLFSKHKSIATTAFAKVYVLKKRDHMPNIQGAPSLLYYILKRVKFSASSTDAFIQQEVNASRKISHTLNNFSHYGKVYVMFLQHTKRKKQGQQLRCWVIQEYFHHTLKTKLKQRATTKEHFTNNFIYQVVDQAVKALYQLQDLQIAHRNVKPANLALDSEDNLRLIDIQEPAYKLKDYHPQAESRYKSPERKGIQFIMHPTDGEILQPHKQDAWSFGITLLQLALLRIDLEDINDEDTLQSHLDQVKILYGQNLQVLIARLLCLHQDARSDFRDLKIIVDDAKLLQLDKGTFQVVPEIQCLTIRYYRVNLLAKRGLEPKYLQQFKGQYKRVKLLLPKYDFQDAQFMQAIVPLRKLLEGTTHVNLILSRSNINDQMFIEMMNIILRGITPQGTLIVDVKGTLLSNISALRLSEIVTQLKLDLTLDVNNCPQISDNCLLNVSASLIYTDRRINGGRSQLILEP